MKDAEPTIERLLTGLRDAEPQPGIEQRILKAMQARESVASVSHWSRLGSQALPAFAVRVASALAVIGVLVAVALHQRWQVPAESGHSHTLAIRQKSPLEAIPKAAVPAQRLVSRTRSKQVRAKNTGPDMQATSFTAPPLPLTEQEKLLLRLARRGKADDMAILDPAAQAAQFAQARKEFQQFFKMNDTEMRSQIE